MTDKNNYNFSNLNAVFINCTLKKSPTMSHTDWLIGISENIMKKHWVHVDIIRACDYDIAPGVYPDMTEHWWDKDEWPTIYKKIQNADILILCSPIWLGEKSSICQKVIERLYGQSGELNNEWQYAYYGRVGWCLITGNEDGSKHCAMGMLYSLQHLGFTIPPQADAARVGEAGPGPSYRDEWSWWPENDFTNRNTTFMTWNLMHMANMLKKQWWIPAYGNQRSKRDAWSRFDFENPEYR